MIAHTKQRPQQRKSYSIRQAQPPVMSVSGRYFIACDERG